MTNFAFARCLMLAVLSASGLSLAGLSAQERTSGASRALGPRSLFPADYNVEARVDVLRFDDLGLLAVVQRSPAAILLAEFKSAFGFALDEVERLTYASAQRESAEAGEWIPPQSLWVFEGSEQVALLERRRILSGIEPTDVGGVACVLEDQECLLSPRAGLVFYVERGMNPVDWVRPILLGESRGGVAKPELTELTTVRNVVASIASIVPRRIQRGENFLPGLTDEALTDADPVHGVRLMMFEPERETLVFEMRLRFANGTEGPDRMLRELARYRDDLKKQPAVKPVLDLLDAIRFDREDADAVLTLELGRGRDAEANLSRLVMLVAQALLMPMRDAAERLQIVDVEVAEEDPVEEPQPATEEPPPVTEPKKRGGG